MSPATGEQGLIIGVTAVGPECTITGYPVLEFIAGDVRVPFTYVHGQGAYVTHRRPQPVTVGHGRIAYTLIAKYRCDLPVARHADGLSVELPGQGTQVSVPRSWMVFSMDYCAAPADVAGNIVDVSPFESDVAHTER